MYKEYIRILSYAQDRQHFMPKTVTMVFGSTFCSIAPFFMLGTLIARCIGGS